MSITLRFWLAAALILAGVGAATGAVLWNLLLFERAFDADTTEHAIEDQAQMLLLDLTNAETGQRGFLITGSDRYLQPYLRASADIEARIAGLKTLVGDDTQLRTLVAGLEQAISQRMTDLRESIEIRRSKGADAAAAIVLSDRGKDAMDEATDYLHNTIAAARGYSEARHKDTEMLKNRITLLFAIGAPGVTGFVLLTIWQTLRSFHKPLRAVEDGIIRIGQGGIPEHIEVCGRDELSQIASAFNRMAERLTTEEANRKDAETRLASMNAALIARNQDAEARTHTIDLLGRMANRLPSCANEEEFVSVIERFVPQLLPGIPGVLYVLSQSNASLRAVAYWNDPQACRNEFNPDACWGLKRGQPHFIDDVHADIICGHVDGTMTSGYRCLPLVAQSETVGLLYLERPAGTAISKNEEQDLYVLAETIALALANLKLRDSLRNQSIRDPLTDLFNRRYLEETMEIERARAVRGKSPLTVMMIDVDHFKRFNDEFGHDAGDAVLKQLAELLLRFIREGDIACRYGGEEFAILLPGMAATNARERGERIREAVEGLSVSHDGRALGAISVSIGVAVFPDSADTAKSLMAVADQALYAAKRDGRNRVEMAPGLSASQAA